VSFSSGAGGLCIADEVQAGYCRLGDPWWGHERYGVVPDTDVLVWSAVLPEPERMSEGGQR
jgi:4-aminobutyrate aminotransferase-like enzyme